MHLYINTEKLLHLTFLNLSSPPHTLETAESKGNFENAESQPAPIDPVQASMNQPRKAISPHSTEPLGQRIDIPFWNFTLEHRVLDLNLSTLSRAGISTSTTRNCRTSHRSTSLATTSWTFRTRSRTSRCSRPSPSTITSSRSATSRTD